jgi:hypothetical protein
MQGANRTGLLSGALTDSFGPGKWDEWEAVLGRPGE